MMERTFHTLKLLCSVYASLLFVQDTIEYKKTVAYLGRIASNMRGRQGSAGFDVAKSEESGKRSSRSCTIDIFSFE